MSISLLASVPSNSNGFGFGAIFAAGSTFNTQVIALLAAIAIVTPYAIRTYRRNAVGRVRSDADPIDQAGDSDDESSADGQGSAETGARSSGPSLRSFSDEIDQWSNPVGDLVDDPIRTLGLPAQVRNGAESLPAQLALAALADSARQSGWALDQVDVAPDGSLSASFTAVSGEATPASVEDGGALTKDSE